MIEVKVVRINSVQDAEIELEDARTKTQVWLVPVVYELADECHVQDYKRIPGSIDQAHAYASQLPMVPTYPTRAVFNEDDELVKVVTRMVPESAVYA
jgi:hypothetical protein